MANKLIGVFHSNNDVQKTVESLIALGYPQEEISILTKQNDDVQYREKIAGAATGGVLGGVAGLVAGMTLLAIPGVGPFLAAGPIAAALGGAAIGATAGGAFVHMGIPQEEVGEYEKHLDEGAILVAVDSITDREEAVYEIFRQNNAVNKRRAMR